jgi:hypothetical protein
MWLPLPLLLQVTQMYQVYRAWSQPDSGVRAILLTGAGGKVRHNWQTHTLNRQARNVHQLMACRPANVWCFKLLFHSGDNAAQDSQLFGTHEAHTQRKATRFPHPTAAALPPGVLRSRNLTRA